MQALVPAVGEPHEQRRLLGARRHAGGKRGREAAFEVDLAVEVGLQQPDMAEERDAPVGSCTAENEREFGIRVARAPFRTVVVAHGERRSGVPGERAKEGLDGGSQGSRFYRPMEAGSQLC